MFTSESTQYLQLVSRILIDGSEEAMYYFGSLLVSIQRQFQSKI